MALPKDGAARKRMPIYSGLLRYFPNACAAVAECSLVGNEQHSPGQPMHWAKAKSSDETDARQRHILDEAMAENGEIPWHDTDGINHAVKTAWRALARLERMHEAGMDIFQTPPITATEVQKSNAEYLEEARREFDAQYIQISSPFRLND